MSMVFLALMFFQQEDPSKGWMSLEKSRRSPPKTNGRWIASMFTP